MQRKLRVAAYAVCVRDEQILLARSPGPDGTPEWVLPGGGMDHGEDPYDTVRREVTEETGYRIEVTGLLGVHSQRLVGRPRVGRRTDHHGLRLVYEGEVVGGRTPVRGRRIHRFRGMAGPFGRTGPEPGVAGRHRAPALAGTPRARPSYCRRPSPTPAVERGVTTPGTPAIHSMAGPGTE